MKPDLKKKHRLFLTVWNVSSLEHYEGCCIDLKSHSASQLMTTTYLKCKVIILKIVQNSDPVWSAFVLTITIQYIQMILLFVNSCQKSQDWKLKDCIFNMFFFNLNEETLVAQTGTWMITCHLYFLINIHFR